MAALGGLLAFSFLACLRCSAAAILLDSHVFEPLRTADCHLPLSRAVCSQVAWFMSNAFREAFRVSLKRFFGPPRARFPCWSSPKSRFFGIRWSAIRATCPAQLSCDCIKMVWMLGRLARVRTSVSGILSCHCMPMSFRSRVVWK